MIFKNLIKGYLKKNGIWDPISRYYYKIKSDKQRELSEEELIKKRKKFYSQFVANGDLVFDVGANIGNRVEVLLSLGCRVVAVEPQEECCKVLEDKFGRNIFLEKCGLGEALGKKVIHICEESVFSSLSVDWINSVKDGRFSEFDRDWNEQREIEMSTVDNLIQKYGVPQFIKIDVEGYELSVLKGLSKKINNISFEYTIPEQKDQIYKCLSVLDNIGDIRVNFSQGESMELELSKWYSYEEFIFILDSPIFNNCPFGDIYVRPAIFQSSKIN